MGRGKSYYTIGEVVNLLKEKYSDLSISKIRYLHKRGLLTPDRTAGGYRKFTQKDLKQLDTVLKLQRDNYLPLDVIKERISLKKKGLDLVEKIAPGDIAQISFDELLDRSKDLGPLSLEQLTAISELDQDQILEMESFGLIRSSKGEEGAFFDGLDLQIVRTVSQFSPYGIYPRHLKMFENFMERSVGFIESVILPKLRSNNPEQRQSAAQEADHLKTLVLKLQFFLLEKRVRSLLRQSC